MCWLISGCSSCTNTNVSCEQKANTAGGVFFFDKLCCTGGGLCRVIWNRENGLWNKQQMFPGGWFTED